MNAEAMFTAWFDFLLGLPRTCGYLQLSVSTLTQRASQATLIKTYTRVKIMLAHLNGEKTSHNKDIIRSHE